MKRLVLQTNLFALSLKISPHPIYWSTVQTARAAYLVLRLPGIHLFTGMI